MAEVSPTTTTTKQDRIRMVILEAGEKAPPSVRPYIKHIASVVCFLSVVWDVLFPLFEKGFVVLKWLYEITPDDLLLAVLGLLMCFFGGTFSALIAAVEAFRLTGWDQTKHCALSLYHDYQTIRQANEEDEKKDEDGDGVADVAVLSASELMARKTHLILVSVKDPEKVSSAVVGIASSCLSVIAVLKVEFAKTITLAVSIGDAMKGVCEAYVHPLLSVVIPQHYMHWMPTAVDYMCKSVAITIAWYISKVISAFHSAIRGGLMFSRNVLVFLNKRGFTNINHEETNLDEIVGWSLAAIGVMFQIRSGFTLSFPLNLILFPLTFAEWLVIWVVSDQDVVVA